MNIPETVNLKQKLLTTIEKLKTPGQIKRGSPLTNVKLNDKVAKEIEYLTNV